MIKYTHIKSIKRQSILLFEEESIPTKQTFILFVKNKIKDALSRARPQEKND